MADHVDRRQALIRAAFSAIAERGFEGFRLRPIAASAGIDHSTLHHYFATKEDLIAAVLEHVTSQLEGTMRTDMEPAARLRHHLDAIAAAIVERPELFVVLDELDLRARRDPTMAVDVRRDEQGWRAALSALFEEGNEQRAWSVDVDASVELVIATLKGIRLHPDTAAAVVRQLCDLFSSGDAS
ncbi:TetR/AcrR family transcriptional regulator [Microbispora sp. NPDC049125]|uniref:TetR/AcrR family transcriptional regulator n=1 Tax=Microbispora sp. NPDC049125 TaxID=3154929 RepID=UPI0034677DD8